MIQISKLSSPTSYFVIQKQAQHAMEIKTTVFSNNDIWYDNSSIVLLFWFTVWQQKLMGEVTGDDYKEQIEHCIC